MPSSFRAADFQRFFSPPFLLPWQPELWMELNSLNNFFVELHLRNITAKFHQDWPSGLGDVSPITTQSQLLTPLEKKVLDNIARKEENAGNQHFLLFPQCFLHFPTQISIFK